MRVEISAIIQVYDSSSECKILELIT